MTDTTVYLTPSGYRKLEEELDVLKDKKRPKLLERLSEASQGGDWSESPEYINYYNDLEVLETQIDQLEQILSIGQLISETNDDDIVDVGETIVVEIDGQLETYTIVGSAEADPDAGFISNESPLGQALLAHQIGEELDIAIPNGMVHCRIVAIE